MIRKIFYYIPEISNALLPECPAFSFLRVTGLASLLPSRSQLATELAGE